ncbi:hypothetical protein ACFW5V_28670 [Streptomyces sp. NPDC058762]|uniref:hypothetical protein n=1 Tax=Streptomyces sp. NPDC058762 TaxID=3346629 RepID=UPI0036C1174D
MARTKTPPPADTTTTPESPPDQPQAQARPSPVLAWPSEWPVPELPAEPRRRTRGLPMGPVLAGAGNGTTLVTTAAYSAGGPVAATAAGVVVAAGATVAVLRRRAAVRRGVATRAGSATAGGRSRSGSGLRSGSGGGALRSRSGAGRSGSGGRSGAGSAIRSGAGRSGGLSSGSGRSPGGGPGRSGKQSGGSRLLRNLAAHHTPHHGPGSGSRREQRAKDKAAAKHRQHATSATPSKGHAVRAAAARATRAAWNTARPNLARAAKATGRAAKKTGGALLDGARAATSAAWTWLRHRDAGAALDRLKAVWRRLRKKRKTTDPKPEPAVADTVRRPTHPNPTHTPGGPMSGGGHHFVAPAMEAARAAAHYQPTGMLQVGADFAGLEEALRLYAEAMKITVENADATQPLHPNIVELMRQIHGLQLKAAELAAELQPAFRSLHDVDIARLENPRKGAAGERMWDVSANL